MSTTCAAVCAEYCVSVEGYEAAQLKISLLERIDICPMHGVESVWLAGCDCGELPEEVKHVDETLATPVQA